MSHKPPSFFGPVDPPRAIDALLAGYAAGSLEPHLHALVESHLILSDENRDVVRRLEAAAGDDLDMTEPAPLDRSARDAVLGAIYAGGWYGRARPQKFDPDLPEPIDRLVRMRLDDVPWKFRAPGLAEHIVHDGQSVTASLIRVQPGRGAPAHTHGGIEVTLVLRGAFADETGRYARGDVAIADGEVDHRPVADPGGPCICFAVTDGPLLLTGPVGRLLQKVFGH